MRLFIKVFLFFLLAWLSMTIFGFRLFVSQAMVEKGAKFPVTVSKDYGIVNDGDTVLVCGYFTGLAVVHRVFWYSPNNILGKDSCPIWTDNK